MDILNKVNKWETVKEMLETGVLSEETIVDIFEESYREAVVGNSGFAAIPADALKVCDSN